VTTIAVDLTPLLPGGDNGGAKTFVLELLRALAALDARDRYVLLTQASSHDELAPLEGATVRRVKVLGGAAGSARGVAYAAARQVIRVLPGSVREGLGRRGYRANVAMKRSGAAGVLRREGVQLLFCPFTSPALREPGIPAVCTVYDLLFRAHPEFFAPEDRAQREAAFEDARENASALAAISDFTRAAVVDAGADPARVRTIRLRPPCVAPEAADPAPLRRETVERERYFLYPANAWPHKNHARLFTAFALACREGLPARMKLVCTGAGLGETLARAVPPDVAARVVFPGFVPEAELAQWLLQARALVFPSLHEGFGLPVAEAMAFGVPVACSRATALPEVAGEAALLFDPEDPRDMAKALVALEGDAGLRARLVAAGRARAAALGTAREMALEYRALFDACV
jgi:glycosyltransferase involved in cell wall biosynthesis